MKKICKILGVALAMAFIAASIFQFSFFLGNNFGQNEVLGTVEAEFCYDGVRPKIIEPFEENTKGEKSGVKKVGPLEYLARLKKSLEGKAKGGK